jgi:hypothetical protein
MVSQHPSESEIIFICKVSTIGIPMILLRIACFIPEESTLGFTPSLGRAVTQHPPEYRCEKILI